MFPKYSFQGLNQENLRSIKHDLILMSYGLIYAWKEESHSRVQQGLQSVIWLRSVLRDTSSGVCPLIHRITAKLTDKSCISSSSIGLFDLRFRKMNSSTHLKISVLLSKLDQLLRNMSDLSVLARRCKKCPTTKTRSTQWRSRNGAHIDTQECIQGVTRVKTNYCLRVKSGYFDSPFQNKRRFFIRPMKLLLWQYCHVGIITWFAYEPFWPIMSHVVLIDVFQDMVPTCKIKRYNSNDDTCTCTCTSTCGYSSIGLVLLVKTATYVVWLYTLDCMHHFYRL